MLIQTHVNKMRRILRVTKEDVTDLMLQDELEFAISTINNRRAYYPTPEMPVVESKYENLMIEMAIHSFSKRGAEGELAHAENGISRTYDTGNIYPNSLLNQIIPRLGSVIINENTI